MSRSRRLPTIGSVREYLNSQAQVTLQTIAFGTPKQQDVWVSDNRLVPPPGSNPQAPSPLAQDLLELATTLDLLPTNDLNTPSNIQKKQTLLIEATKRNNLELVKILLDYGADPSIADSDKNNA